MSSSPSQGRPLKEEQKRNKQEQRKKRSEDGDGGSPVKPVVGKILLPKKGKRQRDEASRSPVKTVSYSTAAASNSSAAPDTPPSTPTSTAKPISSGEFVRNEKRDQEAGKEPPAPVPAARQAPPTPEDVKPLPKLSAGTNPLEPHPLELPPAEKLGDEPPAAPSPAAPSVPSSKYVDALENLPDDDSTPSTGFQTPAGSGPSQGDSGGSKKVRECLYKILVIGELGTGKTSIIKRYVHQFFSQHYRATIGVDFALKVINWDQQTIIRLQLWDIAGQERFGNMTRVYYKEAVGAFIVFDVTRAATFDAVLKWKQDLDAKVQLADGSPIPCVLLANKCDQQKEGLVNHPNKMNEYCEEHKFSGWFETSAKENINIEEAAKTLVDQIVRNDSSNENGVNGARDLSKFPLESSEDYNEGKSCSC